MEGDFYFYKILDVLADRMGAKFADVSKQGQEELLESLLERIMSSLNRVENLRRDGEWGPNEPLFGYFHSHDLVRKRDERLYTGPLAPFDSPDCLHRFSKRNPNVFVTGGDGTLMATAGAIYDALRKEQELKPRFNNKRK